MCIFGKATRLWCVELRNSNKKPLGGYKQPTKGCCGLVNGNIRSLNFGRSTLRDKIL